LYDIREAEISPEGSSGYYSLLVEFVVELRNKNPWKDTVQHIYCARVFKLQ